MAEPLSLSVVNSGQGPAQAGPVRRAAMSPPEFAGGFLAFIFGGAPSPQPAAFRSVSPPASDRSEPPARFQAEWRPVGRPESAPDLELRARSDAKPVSTFAERALAGPRTLYARGEPAQQAEPAEQAEPARPGPDPRFARQMVDYVGAEPPGTVIIDTSERLLYLIESGHRALRYGIGVGRPGFAWTGIRHISMKREWPEWRPPDEMLKRRPDLPRYMAGGPQNPLGARAMYLGSSLYRIHGSNEPLTIGTAVSSGCIRMRNEDVIDLYNRVPVGARVIVI